MNIGVLPVGDVRPTKDCADEVIVRTSRSHCAGLEPGWFARQLDRDSRTLGSLSERDERDERVGAAGGATPN
ncbi:hypothetical protein [Streptantibioticus silvisoli]|uniref:Uncharacterized protein n=1 Tax=Streptantibioticus silvisoli TaxID=2705255 RepID=A0ABT6VV45_9ACTN|nr:hypothetical protein [Streptantibioticus silvisoli]MDI5962352.1 hypothetical protein [Streptantibioticus silvisoli]